MAVDRESYCELLLDIYPTGKIWDKIPRGLRRIVGQTYSIHAGITHEEVERIINSANRQQILGAFDLDDKEGSFRIVSGENFVG